MQERIIVNSNNQDYILKGLRLLTGWDRQLGEDVIEDFSPNATYISFTEVSKSIMPFEEKHGYYLGSQAIQSESFRNYYYNIIHGNAIDLYSGTNFITNDTTPVYRFKL
jgi:hypothetical protein